MSYTVLFWARADRPGDSHFRWTAYRTLRPFTEARVSGALNMDVGTDGNCTS